MNTYRYVYVLRSLTDKMFYVGFTKDLKVASIKRTPRNEKST